MSNLKELPDEEQPDKRLVKFGASSLSDAELLAVILRTGTKDLSPIELGEKLIKSLGDPGLGGLLGASRKSLLKIKGIGDKRTLQLLAIGELAKRISMKEAKSRFLADRPETVAAYYMPKLRYEKVEQIWILALNSKLEIIAEKMLSQGVVNASLITPREVFIYLLDVRAVSFIMIHNHPSGNPKPSRDDIEITLQLAKVGNVMNIFLNDHIIIGDGCFVSLNEQGLLYEKKD